MNAILIYVIIMCIVLVLCMLKNDRILSSLVINGFFVGFLTFIILIVFMPVIILYLIVRGINERGRDPKRRD